MAYYPFLDSSYVSPTFSPRAGSVFSPFAASFPIIHFLFTFLLLPLSLYIFSFTSSLQSRPSNDKVKSQLTLSKRARVSYLSNLIPGNLSPCYLKSTLLLLFLSLSPSICVYLSVQPLSLLAFFFLSLSLSIYLSHSHSVLMTEASPP